MEARANEVITDSYRLLEHLNCLLLKRIVHILRILNRFCFESQALSVPEFGVVGLFCYGSVEVFVSLIELKLVEKHIATVEEDQRVIRVFLDGLIVISLSFIIKTQVIVSQPSVVKMERMRFDRDCFRKLRNRFLKVFLLKV